MKIGFFTLGCKLNQLETEAIADAFASRGHEPVPAQENAELYIVNTCTVTSKGEQKARRMIRYLLREHPHAAVVVTGCYAQLDPKELKALGDRVIVVPGAQKARLLDLPPLLTEADTQILEPLLKPDGQEPKHRVGAGPLKEKGSSSLDPFRFNPSQYVFHARAFLKIQDGCDHRCAYCRVRLARGPSVSLPLPIVVDRFSQLVSKGFKEIVLTGVNISQYGWDNRNLGDLLLSLVNLPGEARIRLSSLEPEAFTGPFVEAISHPKVCPHFHLSVQSGSDEILRAMGRTYSADRIVSIIGLVRQVKENPYVAGDFIVGFPGEGERQYRETCQLIEQAQFTDIHVFPFSPRPGTEAFSLTPRVPERVSRERVREIARLSDRLFQSYLEAQVGTRRQVLVESESPGYWMGTTENYLSVRLPSYSVDPTLKVGKGHLRYCRIIQREDKYLIGEII